MTQTPPVLSPEFLRRAERVQGSPDDAGTAKTIAIMCEHIRRSAQDPQVRACAYSAVGQWRGGPVFGGAFDGNTGRDPFTCPQALAESVWWYVKHQCKFVHHGKLIDIWLGEHDQLQLLIAPDLFPGWPGWFEGDCAIYSMLECAFLDVLGIQWELVTLAVDPKQPDVFSHVYPRAVIDGRRIALDASHGKYPGWSVPVRDIFRTQVWDGAGEPVADQASRYDGLHGYELADTDWLRPSSYAGIAGRAASVTMGDAPLNSVAAGLLGFGDTPIGHDNAGLLGFGDMPLPCSIASLDDACADFPWAGANSSYGGLMGLGDDTTDLPFVDPTTFASTTDTTAADLAALLTAPPAYSAETSATPSAGAGTIVMPASTDPSFTGAVTALAKMGLTLAEINSIQPGTVVGANGQILRQATGLPVPVGTNSLTTALGTGSSGMLLLGGLALVAVLMLSKR
jgi:hypothetical protein